MTDKFEAEFREKHEAFSDRLDRLVRAIEIAYDRRLTSSAVLDHVIFSLGIRCADDFMSILTLGKEGRGYAALALLRALYERVVTAEFLRLNPETADAFVQFESVRSYKLGNKIKNVLGDDLPPDFEAIFAKVSTEYERVKENFRITDCRKCKTTRINNSWNALDFVSMAGNVPPLGSIIVPAYYLPLDHTHATAKSGSVLAEQTEGEFVFTLEHFDASLRAFEPAHLLLLHSLIIQRRHFELAALGQPLEDAVADYRSVWGKPVEGAG